MLNQYAENEKARIEEWFSLISGSLTLREIL